MKPNASVCVCVCVCVCTGAHDNVTGKEVFVFRVLCEDTLCVPFVAFCTVGCMAGLCALFGVFME